MNGVQGRWQFDANRKGKDIKLVGIKGKDLVIGYLDKDCNTSK